MKMNKLLVTCIVRGEGGVVDPAATKEAYAAALTQIANEKVEALTKKLAEEAAEEMKGFDANLGEYLKVRGEWDKRSLAATLAFFKNPKYEAVIKLGVLKPTLVSICARDLLEATHRSPNPKDHIPYKDLNKVQEMVSAFITDNSGPGGLFTIGKGREGGVTMNLPDLPTKEVKAKPGTVTREEAAAVAAKLSEPTSEDTANAAAPIIDAANAANEAVDGLPG